MRNHVGVEDGEDLVGFLQTLDGLKQAVDFQRAGAESFRQRLDAHRTAGMPLHDPVDHIPGRVFHVIDDDPHGIARIVLLQQSLDALRQDFQVIILSDTFYEFAMPLMKQLGMPTLFCHKLEADANGYLVNYHLRMANQKKEAVQRFKEINFKTIAAGDSYNDTAMLKEAHAGILFRAPDKVIAEFPQFPVVREYADLAREIRSASARI